MRIEPRLAATGLAVLMTASSCSILGGATPPRIHYYKLDYERIEARATTFPVVLRAMPLKASPMYDGHRIVVQEGAHELGSYHYRRWSTDPAQMVGALVRRDLADSGMFRAVIDGVAPTTSDYSISGIVEEIEQRTDGGCAAHLRTRFLLAGQSHSGTVFQKHYQVVEPCESDRVEDLVAAMSRAVSRISTLLLDDIEAAIRSDRQKLQGANDLSGHLP